MKPLFFSILAIAGLYSTLSAQINWQHTNGPEGGATWYIYSNDQYAFYPDQFNFYRTADGANWEKLPYGNLWPIATSPGTLAALQGYGFSYSIKGIRFVVSHDNGSTWLEGTLPPTKYKGFSKLAVCTHGIYVPEGAQNKMFRSQDDGLTWDTIPTPGPYCYDVYAFEDRLYAEWHEQYWRLGLNGTTWQLVSPAFGAQIHPNGIYVSGPNFMFSTEHSLWSSVDSGLTWVSKAINFHNSIDHFARVGNRMYKGGGNTTGLVYSDNFGQTWVEAPIPSDYSATDFGTAGGRLLAATYNKGVMTLDAANNVFVPANTGLQSAAVYNLEISSNTLWGACGNAVSGYDFTTKQWNNQVPLPIPAYQYGQVKSSQSGKLAVYEWDSDYFYLSQDNGTSWTKIYPFAGVGGGYFKRISWLGDVLMVYGDGGGLRSADYGQTWENTPLSGDIVPFNGKYYAIDGAATGIVSTADFGLTWQDEPSLNTSYKYALFASSDRLFMLVATDAFKVQLYTSSDGQNWTFSNDGLPYTELNVDPIDVYRGGAWQKNGKYYYYEPSSGFFASLDSCKTWLPLEHNPYNHLVLHDTTFYSGGFGGGVLKTGLPQNYGSLSSGVVYNDLNSNGAHDSGEPGLNKVEVYVEEPDAWYPYWFVLTGQDGQYVIGTTPGDVDTLRPLIPSPYITSINPPYRLINSSGSNRDFGFHFIPNVTDMWVGGLNAGYPRPGFTLSTFVEYGNIGTIPASGTVSVKLDPKFHYTSAEPAPTAVIGSDSLVWNFAQMPMLTYQIVRIEGQVDVNGAIGSPFVTRGYVVPALSDSMPGNNQFVLNDSIRGAFDPNFKQVTPARGLTPTEIAAGKELTYTIQFQNTGNAGATRVRITDKLDTALNLKTLRLVGSSHPVTRFTLLPGGLLEVVFNPIALPDSVSNEPASHGFVSFAIQRNKNYSPSYIIQNQAAIYFDYNEPIFTNTVKTGLVSPTVATSEPDKGKTTAPTLLISPNPTQQYFAVQAPGGKLTGIGELAMFNMEGQVCLQQEAADLSKVIRVDAGRLPNGAYIVRLTGKTGILSGKVVIQH